MTKILIIDDEPDVTRAVRIAITVQEKHWSVTEIHNGADGLRELALGDPDVVLLDLSMPEMHGFDVLKEIRVFSSVPVIVLTVQDGELEKVRGLELGADDYVTKPFGNLELLARIRSVLRRADGNVGPAAPPYTVDDLLVDFGRRRVMVRNDDVQLTKTEFRLLEILAKNAGQVVPNDVLLEKIWGRYMIDESNHLKVFVYRIRQKIEPDPSNPRYLHNQRGVGYWLARA